MGGLSGGRKASDQVVMTAKQLIDRYAPLSPKEMGSALSMLSPREASEFLIQKARSRAHGGGDNLSLVIVKLEPRA